MKTRLLTLLLATGVAANGLAVTSINLTNNYAYGANLGWMDWRGNVNNGAIIGEYVCSGFIYAANVGWIRLGNGSPTNGIQYQNLSANDYGVNHDGLGNLRGTAYGANIGWISFEKLGRPTVDLDTGILSGYAYSANCGWISLSNQFAFVQTDTIPGGTDADGDGMADAWERLNFGSISANPGDDPDGDGATNLAEYLAGTDPNNNTSYLVITAYTLAPGGTAVSLTWQSVLTRRYLIEQTLDLSSPGWYDSGLGLISPSGAATSASFTDTNAPRRFYRVEAIRPLSP